jgi:hypothetical protein
MKGLNMINETNNGMKTTEMLTSCIVHLAVSANLEGITSNKLCSGLTGLCFESPNDTIHATVSKLRIVKKKS